MVPYVTRQNRSSVFTRRLIKSKDLVCKEQKLTVLHFVSLQISPVEYTKSNIPLVRAILTDETGERVRCNFWRGASVCAPDVDDMIDLIDVPALPTGDKAVTSLNVNFDDEFHVVGHKANVIQGTLFYGVKVDEEEYRLIILTPDPEEVVIPIDIVNSALDIRDIEDLMSYKNAKLKITQRGTNQDVLVELMTYTAASDATESPKARRRLIDDVESELSSALTDTDMFD